MLPVTLPEITPSNNQPRNSFGLRLGRLAGGASVPHFEPGQETRIYRKPVRLFGKITFNDKTLFGLLLNVSSEGCLLKTEATFPIDASITIHVTRKNDEGFPCEDSVEGYIRRQTSIDGRNAYGIEFKREDG